MSATYDAASVREQMRRGNEAFRQGAYEEALDAYQRAQAAGADSADLWFNLGQAHHRLGRWGEAAWAWEQALVTRPWDVEAQRLLEATRAQAGAPAPVRPFGGALDGIDPDGAAVALLLGAWLLWGAVVGWSRGLLRGRLAAGLLVVALAAGGWGGAGTWAAASLRGGAWAVAVRGAEARVAPHDDANPLFAVPQATRVELLRREGPWVQVEVPGGRRGWVPAEGIRTIGSGGGG